MVVVAGRTDIHPAEGAITGAHDVRLKPAAAIGEEVGCEGYGTTHQVRVEFQLLVEGIEDLTGVPERQLDLVNVIDSRDLDG